MSEWTPIPLDQKVFQNVPETSLQKLSAAMENVYLNEAGGHSRFPGLKRFLQIPNETGDVYLSDNRDDLIAVTGTGRFFRIDEAGNVENVTGVQLAGGLRPVFAKTEDELVVAAGAEILRFAGYRSEILSRDAPLATHVGYVDGYVIANERNSGRFAYSDAGAWRVWDPLNILSAESNPDIVTAIAVTPFREVLVSGPQSVEQYERLLDGTTPFFRRWGVGEGLGAIYTMVPADNGVWFVNSKFEFVRASGQVGRPVSNDIQQKLDRTRDWSGAWATEMILAGQKFMLLVLPNAINTYETRGITLLFDYKNGRWSYLYGWNNDLGLPEGWPGVSYNPLWQRHFVGGKNGIIYELDPDYFQNDGSTQRVLYRSGHFDQWGAVSIDAMRVRCARGDHLNENEPVFRMRVNKDNRIWTRWMERSLGRRGDRSMFVNYPSLGMCNSFQIEYVVTDNCRWEFANLKAVLTQLGT